MSKQDRQGVRTPSDLERKYKFSEISSQQSVTALQGEQIARLSQASSQYMNETNGALSAMDEKVNTAGQNITALQSSVASLESRMTKAESEDFQLDQAIQGVEQRMSTLENTVTTMATTIAALEARVAALEST